MKKKIIFNISIKKFSRRKRAKNGPKLVYKGSVNSDLPSYKFSPCVKLRNSSNWGAVSADLGHIPFPKWTRPRSQNNFISLVSFQNFQIFSFDSENKDFDLSVQFIKIKKKSTFWRRFFFLDALQSQNTTKLNRTSCIIIYGFYQKWNLSVLFIQIYHEKTCKTIKTDASPSF